MRRGSFKDLSIHKKLVLIILANVIVSLIIASFIFVTYDRHESRSSLVNEVKILSEVIAERSVAAISFRDKRVAKSNLESLKHKQSIVQACLYLADGTLFQEFTKKENKNLVCLSKDQISDSIIIDDDYLHLNKEISFKNKPVGYLNIQVSLSDINKRQDKITLISALMIIASSLFSYLITFKMQRSVTNPVKQLTRVANKVRKSSDYSLRAEHETNDEVGDLVDSFNSMLGTIQEAHLQLREVMTVLSEKEQESTQKALSSDEKNKAIKEFFAGVSHDLKQPLNAMSLFIEAIKNENDQKKRLNLCSKLEQSIHNFNSLFTDLLDVNRLEYGQMKLDLDEVSIGTITRNIAHEYGVLADDKGIRLSVRGCAHNVLSNSTILERIIRNLISNAIRYTDEGGVLVGCRKRGNKVYMDVWDSGVGIPKEKLSEIFLPHTQLNNPDQAPEKGFGLGLSVVKKLCGQLGHTLTVKSKIGSGTLMRIEISSSQKESIVSETPLKLDLSDPLSGMRILIVDDEPEILQGMELVFESWGCNYCLAENMRQVEDIIDRKDVAPDLIISDYTLSESMTGDKVIQFVREKTKKTIPAIIITGESDENLLNDIRNLGFNVLPKPVKPVKLRSLISYIIKNRQ